MPGFTSVTFQQGGLGSSSSGNGENFGGGKGLGRKAKNILNKVLGKGKRKGKNKTKRKQLPYEDDVKPNKSAMDRLKGIQKGMKNKSISDIRKNAPDAKTARKQIAREVGKRVIKKAAQSAIGAGASYAVHLATGGDPLSSKDLKDMTTDATVGIVKKSLNGNLNEKAIEGEMVDSYNRVIQRRGGKPVKSFSRSMERIVALRNRLHSAHDIRHRELHGDRRVLAIGPKPFGSGKMAAGKRGKRSAEKKKPKKKKPKKKKKKKKGGNNGKKSKKFNVMKNVQRKRQTYDVFDV